MCDTLKRLFVHCEENRRADITQQVAMCQEDISELHEALLSGEVWTLREPLSAMSNSSLVLTAHEAGVGLVAEAAEGTEERSGGGDCGGGGGQGSAGGGDGVFGSAEGRERSARAFLATLSQMMLEARPSPPTAPPPHAPSSDHLSLGAPVLASPPPLPAKPPLSRPPNAQVATSRAGRSASASSCGIRAGGAPEEPPQRLSTSLSSHTSLLTVSTSLLPGAGAGPVRLPLARAARRVAARLLRPRLAARGRPRRRGRRRTRGL